MKFSLLSRRKRNASFQPVLFLNLHVTMLNRIFYKLCKLFINDIITEARRILDILLLISRHAKELSWLILRNVH